MYSITLGIRLLIILSGRLTLDDRVCLFFENTIVECDEIIEPNIFVCTIIIIVAQVAELFGRIEFIIKIGSRNARQIDTVMLYERVVVIVIFETSAVFVIIRLWSKIISSDLREDNAFFFFFSRHSSTSPPGDKNIMVAAALL